MVVVNLVRNIVTRVVSLTFVVSCEWFIFARVCCILLGLLGRGMGLSVQVRWEHLRVWLLQGLGRLSFLSWIFERGRLGVLRSYRFCCCRGWLLWWTIIGTFFLTVGIFLRLRIQFLQMDVDSALFCLTFPIRLVFILIRIAVLGGLVVGVVFLFTTHVWWNTFFSRFSLWLSLFALFLLLSLFTWTFLSDGASG